MPTNSPPEDSNSPASPTATATDTDVLIIGAGLSGLYLAHRLASSALRVEILEARRRVGGRLLSVETQESTDPEADLNRIDFGATWFWGNEPNIAKLCQELEIKTFGQYTEGDDLVEMPDELHRSRFARAAVERRIAGGAARITDRLAEKLPTESIRLGARVRVIEQRDDHLLVRYEQDGHAFEKTARHVAVSLPPALAASTLTFQPKLDEELTQVLENVPVWMGATGKVVVLYKHPFWRDEGLSGRISSRIGPLYEIHDACGPGDEPAALFGFVMPRAADDPGPTREEVIEQLIRIFGEKAAEATSVHRHFWWHEQLTVNQGSLPLQEYSLYGHPALNRPAWDGRLHWIATETAVYAPGHMEGALETSGRVAEMLLSAEE